MNKKLFLSLFNVSNNNGFIFNQNIYNLIMKQVLENITNEEFNIFEIKTISYSKTTRYTKEESYDRNLDFLQESLLLYDSLNEDQKLSAKMDDSFFIENYNKQIVKSK
ncbi:hypothetical protein [[Mycoplasma] anseris]|uniref:Uncharacterized protein n=1 Tax=[Mycoplasma] anseris TaxID=92400 RepID=A0A2Z4NDA1_9BACT|nr:hypothetical protein [[Mycoplasma] anseris]AWX69562.1 hypothetical protein DP065_02240 [[Mycoplasma] anseris]